MSNNDNLFVDVELREIVDRRIEKQNSKLFTVGSGITSSHLGDERNLREFLFAGEVVKYLRNKDINVFFYLADDSYDPLTYRELRIAVNKDEEMINRFKRYCGVPIRLIPDPYDCHKSYSTHFQEEIMKRLNYLGVVPNIFDSYSAYTSNQYNQAKEIVFSRYEEIRTFLKEKFPTYTMKKIFYPVCLDCMQMEGVDLVEIKGRKIVVECSGCKRSFSVHWGKAKGKFGWKIDTAIKWNLLNTDIEPYSRAYLDPKAGSYFIAKALSEHFFGGNVPEIIEYGLIDMDKNFSNTLLSSLPSPVLKKLFLERRRSDLTITSQKVIQVSKKYLLENNLSYYDYVQAKLPYDFLDRFNNETINQDRSSLVNYGLNFTKHVLKRELRPQLPTKKDILKLDIGIRIKIKSLLEWIIDERSDNREDFESFTKNFLNYLKKNKIQKTKLFPIIRELLSQKQALPIHRLLFYAPINYIYACAYLFD